MEALMPYLDFKEIKASCPIEEVVKWLEIELKPAAGQLRGPCPFCGGGGERGFVVTPSKGLWKSFCSKDCGGGDVLSLVARQFGCSTRDAALKLSEQFLGNRNGNSEQVTNRSNSSVPTTSEALPPQPADALKPLDYLTTDHPAIEALGLTVAACNALGIGFSPKGTMRGRVVFPLRLPGGALCGYAGLATKADMAPLMLLPKNLEQMISAPVQEEKPQPVADDIRQFLRVVK